MVLVATQVKRRRGTNDENDAFAGAEGEITVDLTNKELRVHDGSGKTGGFRIGHYSYTTNCMTDIPQDIKLELNNGTLTLKAGSKVYVPNGSRVFNTISITTDKSSSSVSAGNGQYLILCQSDGGIATAFTNVSSSTTPTTPTNGMVWYDTANNLVKRYWGGTWYLNFSLPIALVTITNGTFASIDQVFNGFGYIGSTVFALPGISVLAPNGRNADGTLKNIVWKGNLVITRTDSNPSGRAYLAINTTNGSFGIGQYQYDEFENYNKLNGVISEGRCIVAQITNTSGGVITNLTPKTVFRAVGYNDTEYIAHQAMPSDRYVNLTLGASGATYTAPTDGYYQWSGVTTDSNGYFRLYNTDSSIGIETYNNNNGFGITGFLPVRKGNTVGCSYERVNITQFRFVYANGSK